MPLPDPAALRHLLINGALVAGDAQLDVVDPTTGAVFAQAPRASAAQAERAIAAAKTAQPGWEALGYDGRRPYLHALADALDARVDDLATVLTRERGGPIAECRREVGIAAGAIRHFADQRLEDEVRRDTEAELIVSQRYAQGVVVAITPWNRPMTLLSFKLGPALITGNTVISKPAPTTPLATLLLGEIASTILPPGVFQTLTDANDLGPLLTSHPDVAHVSFTGSTPTGKKVLTSAAGTMKRFTLELGGNDAAIILDDADLDVVLPRIFAAAMINAGQVCYAAKRIYAPAAMLDAVSEGLAALARAAVLGDGLDPATTIGPVQNKMQFEKVLGYLQSARDEGGTILSGGEALGRGYFIAPTIVRDLPLTARLVREEQFGPALPVLGYETMEDVIAEANNSEFGLGGSIWTGDVARGIAVASRIQSGTVWVNRHMSLPYDVPFGGAKESGLGLQNGHEGMEDFTQLRIVNVARSF